MSYLLMQEEAQCRLQACAQDTECQEATWRPLARQVDDALKCKADRLLLTSSGLGNGEKEVVSKSITIEATPGLPLPAILNCGLATRQPGRGPQTVLTLRRVRLQRPDQSQPLLEVGAGTACELYDCFVEGGIKLCEGARAKLIRTQIQGFGGAGISGRAFNCLSLLACTISDCADDGLLLRHGKADVVDCTINNSGQSGLVFGPGQWQLMGSTVSGSGQYGLWAEADAMVSCRPLNAKCSLHFLSCLRAVFNVFASCTG
ncbi:Hypothetical protein (Fragment) [Durusdinium trenchii]|uniref:Right handed beta helix domain-containing protein n=1 Tax=Durusdinium trenchii TaxID=1381693 RepID=A0ABP0QWP2_9DINO